MQQMTKIKYLQDQLEILTDVNNDVAMIGNYAETEEVLVAYEWVAGYSSVFFLSLFLSPKFYFLCFPILLR